LNEQRERNPEKFPEDFAYQVTDEELDNLTRLSQHVITSTKFSPVNPWAYTLEGCNMAATILNTPTAVKRAVQIIRTFSDKPIEHQLNNDCISTLLTIPEKESFEVQR
jgi:hypothetical protein